MTTLNITLNGSEIIYLDAENRNIIKTARKEKRIFQKQLAKKIGKSYVTISSIETGKKSPRMSTLQAICEVLELEIKIKT